MDLATISLGHDGHYDEVRDFLREHAVIGQDEEAEIVIDGIAYRIVDICLRMLRPRELYRAQDFNDGYIIDPIYKGKPLTLP
jgi:DNA (cytosine-5)-methyltransferase 1